MRYILTTTWIWLLLATSAGIGQPAADMSQLRQLNRAGEQELRNLQQPPGYPVPALSRDQQLMRQRLNVQQNTEQQMLQERQRRELLLLNHRAGMPVAPGWQLRLEAINRQRQFWLQQQNQMNRFRGQQGRWIR